MTDPRHILKLSCGLTVELTLHESTGIFNCEWSPHLPTKKMLPLIEAEYIPWRNSILESWTERSGKKMLVIDI